MNNKVQVARHFGKMSRKYDDYAVVQKHMGYTLQQLAETTGPFENILEIGCGTGFFTRLIATTFPNAKIIATDISPAMLTTAQTNLAGLSNIHYTLEDGENLTIADKFDLIISNAAFQWFNDHTQAFTNFCSRLSPGGFVLFSTFGSHTFRELDDSFQSAEQLLGLETTERHGPRFINIDSMAFVMQHTGFSAEFSEEIYTEYFPSVRDFLTSVKNVGANNAKQHIIANRRLMFAMMNYYTQHYSRQGQIPVTYHVIYGKCQKVR